MGSTLESLFEELGEAEEVKALTRTKVRALTREKCGKELDIDGDSFVCIRKLGHELTGATEEDRLHCDAVEMSVTLTIPQLATLYYIWQVHEVTRYYPSNGTIPMQYLTEKGLLRVSDTTYKAEKHIKARRNKTWSITRAGKEFIRLNNDAAERAMKAHGWDL